jgi:hypothetical protein
MGVAEEGHCQFVIKAVGAGAGHQLVQHGQGITDRSTACPDHQGQNARGHRNVFLVAQQLQICHQGLGRYQPERVVVGAGADGADDFVRLRGGEDELDVLRGLFDDLEEGVEAGGRDHVGLIDDEDLVAVPDGGVGCAFAQVTGIVHAAVAGGVNLDDVKGA